MLTINGASVPLLSPVAVGSNVFNISAVSGDGTHATFYTLDITRRLDPRTAISSIIFSGGALVVPVEPGATFVPVLLTHANATVQADLVAVSPTATIENPLATTTPLPVGSTMFVANIVRRR